ncbi:MAG: hypothetical protein RLZZ265_3544, partial [Verrucomicrobiota bacterium]
FAPVLGNLIADAVERIPGLVHDRFKWRERKLDSGEGARAK